MEIIFLSLGIAILIIAIYDFFFTTLSGGGAAFITRMVTFVSQKFLRLLVNLFGRRMYSLSGMVVNVLVLLVWIAIIWTGLFLIFSSDPDAIVNNSNRPADIWERLYFTGYVLSTLGLGDFKPITPAFELLTGIFSFYGFIFFTTSMTYLVSVSSAVIHKRSLALSIRNLGNTPEDMVYRLLNQDLSFSRQNLATLQDKIERHAINLQAYPVLHNYANSQKAGSLSLNLVALDEALSILLNSKDGDKMKNALTAIRAAVSYFLNHMESNFSRTIHSVDGPDIHHLPGWELITHTFHVDPQLQQRRRLLGGILKHESFDWDDVYRTKTTIG